MMNIVLPALFTNCTFAPVAREKIIQLRHTRKTAPEKVSVEPKLAERFPKKMIYFGSNFASCFLEHISAVHLRSFGVCNVCKNMIILGLRFVGGILRQ
jgi:hypothetical protein